MAFTSRIQWNYYISFSQILQLYSAQFLKIIQFQNKFSSFWFLCRNFKAAVLAHLPRIKTSICRYDFPHLSSGERIFFAHLRCRPTNYQLANKKPHKRRNIDSFKPFTNRKTHKRGYTGVLKIPCYCRTAKSNHWFTNFTPYLTTLAKIFLPRSMFIEETPAGPLFRNNVTGNLPATLSVGTH